MRVLVITPGWPNDFAPASLPWVRDQCAALAKRHEVHPAVIHSRTHWWQPRYWPERRARGRGPSYLGVDGLAPTPLPHWSLPRKVLERQMVLPQLRRAIARAYDETPLDLVHAHFASPAGTLARWYAARRGIPYVVTEHAGDFRHLLRVGVDVPAVYRDAATVLCVSEAMRDAILEALPHLEADLRVVPNGVPLDRFAEAGRGKPADPDALRLLYVGHLVEPKGGRVLLEALAMLRRDGARHRLRLVGAGPEAARLRERARLLGLEEAVDFSGALSPDAMPTVYAEADLFVQPSFRESFSVVCVEALAAGLPVVATRSGGPEGIVTPEVGRLVAPRDAEALRDGIAGVSACIDSFRAENLRRYASERFSLDAVAGHITAVYREATDGGGDRKEPRHAP